MFFKRPLFSIYKGKIVGEKIELVQKNKEMCFRLYYLRVGRFTSQVISAAGKSKKREARIRESVFFKQFVGEKESRIPKDDISFSRWYRIQ